MSFGEVGVNATELRNTGAWRSTRTEGRLSRVFDTFCRIAGLRPPRHLICLIGEPMFSKPAAPVVEAPVDVVDSPPADSLIPLSVLELDYPAPRVGWLIELDRRGIKVVDDDLGRKAIARADARQLLAEQRENELRQREAAERREQAAVEADRVRRASIWGGISALDLPPGARPAAVMLQAARDAQPKRLTPLQEALSENTLTYHSFGPTPEDES